MTFARLRLADWVALLAAAALLFTMALDWYSTKVGDDHRDTQQRIDRLPPGTDEEGVGEQARFAAQAEEQTAWQAEGAIDRVIAIGLLAAIALAVAAAYFRAAGRRFEPPWTPSALTGLVAAITALLVLYRIIQEPGLDEATVVKAGAPLAIVVLGVLAYASATALRAEEAGTAFREPPQPAPAGNEPQPPEQPA